MNLLMIVPTRNRPQNAQYLHANWVDNTTGSAELLFVVDEDDPQRDSYRNQMAWLPKASLMIVPAGLGMVGALNEAAKTQLAPGQYDAVGFMGDDHRPRTRGWDERLCAALDHPVGIAYGNDMLQGEKMATAVVMTANIPQTLGYMAPPTFGHLCVDLVWCDWGRALNMLRYLDDVVIEHMHPANGKALNDAGYLRVNSSDQMKRDSEAYYAYMANEFDADIDKLRDLQAR